MQTAVRRTVDIMKAAATIKMIMKRLIMESEMGLLNPGEPEGLTALAPFGIDLSTSTVSIVCV